MGFIAPVSGLRLGAPASLPASFNKHDLAGKDAGAPRSLWEASLVCSALANRLFKTQNVKPVAGGAWNRNNKLVINQHRVVGHRRPLDGRRETGRLLEDEAADVVAPGDVHLMVRGNACR